MTTFRSFIARLFAAITLCCYLTTAPSTGAADLEGHPPDSFVGPGVTECWIDGLSSWQVAFGCVAVARVLTARELDLLYESRAIGFGVLTWSGTLDSGSYFDSETVSNKVPVKAECLRKVRCFLDKINTAYFGMPRPTVGMTKKLWGVGDLEDGWRLKPICFGLAVLPLSIAPNRESTFLFMEGRCRPAPPPDLTCSAELPLGGAISLGSVNANTAITRSLQISIKCSLPGTVRFTAVTSRTTVDGRPSPAADVSPVRSVLLKVDGATQPLELAEVAVPGDRPVSGEIILNMRYSSVGSHTTSLVVTWVMY